MPTYLITEVERKKDIEMHGKAMVIYNLRFESGEQAELKQLLATPPPAMGSTLEGVIQQTQWGPQFKKDKKGDYGSSNGGGGWTPKKEKEVNQEALLKVSVEHIRNMLYAKQITETSEDELWGHATRLREKVEGLS